MTRRIATALVLAAALSSAGAATANAADSHRETIQIESWSLGSSPAPTTIEVQLENLIISGVQTDADTAAKPSTVPMDIRKPGK